jgi:hypothetical protein
MTSLLSAVSKEENAKWMEPKRAEAIMSLIMVAGAQSLVDIPGASVDGSMTFKELIGLQTNKKLIKLASDAHHQMTDLSQRIAQSLKAFEDSNKGDEENVPYDPSMPPMYLGDTFDEIMRTIKSYADETTVNELEKVYGTLVAIFLEVAASIDIVNGDAQEIAERTATFVLRAELMRSIQWRATNDNKLMDSTGQKLMNSGIFSLAIKQLNNKAGETLRDLVDDIVKFSYSYRMISEAVASINEIRYSDSSMTSLLTYYTSTMSGIYDIKNEAEVTSLMESFRRNAVWKGSLANILHSLAIAPINDEKKTGSDEYGRLLTIMDNVLSNNRFFSVKLSPHITELALSASKSPLVAFGHVFTITEKSLDAKDVFIQGDDMFNSLPAIFDALNLVLVNPMKSPMFDEIYKVVALKTVLSEQTRLLVASNVRPPIMEPFKISDDNVSKMMPFMSSISYALMGSMGVYYIAAEITRLVALRYVSGVFKDLVDLATNEEFSSISVSLKAEKGYDKIDEVTKLLSEIDKVLVSKLSSSEISVDRIRVIVKSDVLWKNKGMKYVEDICRKYISKQSLRSAYGILYNTLETTLKREIVGVTVFSTANVDDLADSLKRSCIETVSMDSGANLAEKKDIKSSQAAIERLRDDMANKLKLNVQDHAIGRLLSMSFSLQSVLGHVKSSDSSRDDINNVLMRELARDILTIKGKRVFHIASNVARLERAAYSVVKPSLFRMLTAFRYEWRHRVRSVYAPQTEQFNFYDEKHAILRILETAGIDPNTKLSDNDRRFLGELLGAGSILSYKKTDSQILFDNVHLNRDDKTAASKNGLLTYCTLPIQSVGDIFSDRVVIDSSLSHSHLMLVNKLSRDAEIIDTLESLDMKVMVTSVEDDPVAAQFITADVLAKRIFDDFVEPLVNELWE